MSRLTLKYINSHPAIHREIREELVFKELLKLCPDLEERIMNNSEEEVGIIADLVSLNVLRPLVLIIVVPQIQKGVNGARADDTKGLKTSIVDWITPPGQNLDPLINRKVKSMRGFHHKRTGALLCPAGLDWSSPM